jgi:predicted TIM-barrel fold metal-dependent hydrolase
MNRRQMLRMGTSALVAPVLSGCPWPEQGFVNACMAGRLPDDLAGHPLIRAAWSGLEPGDLWDCHVHLFGIGDTDSGIWISPDMYRLSSPIKMTQRWFYENAACVAPSRPQVDAQIVARLVDLLEGMRDSVRSATAGQPKAMLFAFDWFHDEQGRPVAERTSFHVPNAYARRIVQQQPRYFEWVASIHPYRGDAVDALEAAAAGGARAIKWLPAAMGIDPAAARCDLFYAAAARLRIPIISHAGEELAVDGAAYQRLGNPLRLRRALDAGVRVIVAHCASRGEDIDLDRGEYAPLTASFALFSRLMEEPAYAGRLFGDISALPQANRAAILGTLLERTHWHSRLLQGSDYPLPGVMPLFSVKLLVDKGWLEASAAPVLKRLREHNAMLFDFVLKRSLRSGGHKFGNAIFATRSRFDNGLAGT